MKTYIFAIGGTGARVLRSLTMLLAAGVKGTDTGKEIVPVIIDYDGSNGDTERTEKIMEKYQCVHNVAYKDKVLDHQEHFFCTPLKSLKEQVGDSEIIPEFLKYRIPLQGMRDDTTYSSFINYNALNTDNDTLPTRKLLESLYSNEKADLPNGEENLKAELHMKLHHGFRGCPNIGSVVTKELIKGEAFRRLNFQDGDRVFIIGSIFGGTGASGIPTLLNHFKETIAYDVKVGVLAVTPYFTLDRVDDKESPIDSNTFDAKTKAALKAYEDTVYQKADAVYMVGDKEQAKPFANVEGGDAQKNNAHIVELVGAMMAIDFINRDADELQHGFFEFGLKNYHDATTDLVYDDFYPQTTEPYFDPLARFVFFKQFCEDFMFKLNFDPRDLWRGHEDTATELIYCGQFREYLRYFFKDFDGWVKELENPEYRPFKLFNLDEKDYNKLLEYHPLKGVVSRDKIREYLSVSNGDPSKKKDGSTNEEKYAKHPEELYLVNAHNAFKRVQDDIDHYIAKTNKIM